MRSPPGVALAHLPPDQPGAVSLTSGNEPARPPGRPAVVGELAFTQAGKDLPLHAVARRADGRL
ncbi:hypothetical protein [Streptomyces sp. NPDC007856]|uniref:hypothetical protein n=1 Tax=Streptomyces sp. NPDC007856 TaxID=3364781 RepID=UPI0036C8DD17